MNRSWPTFPQLIVAASATFAIVAIVLGFYLGTIPALSNESSTRFRRAKFHARRAGELQMIVEDWRNARRVFQITKEEGEAVAAWIDLLIPYHRRMGQKWDHGAHLPMIFVEPDPQEPQPPDFD